MDQCKNGVLLFRDVKSNSEHQGPFFVKQMQPECTVSVKLETREEKAPTDARVDRSLTVTDCCIQPDYSCICRDSQSDAAVTTPCSSVPFTCQVVRNTMMPEQEGQSSQQSEASPQQNSQSSTHSRSTPSAHSSGYAHARSAELSWLPHGYVDTAVVSPGGQQFPHHQMQYITADGIITQAPGERIMVKQGVSSSGVRTDNAGIISTISGLTETEGCDSNTFINYVLNQQRGGSGSGILLPYDSRNLPSHLVQQSHEIATDREDVGRSAHNSTLSLKLESRVDESPRNSTPAENSDPGSAADSPNPGEVVGNQVSRYCQTMPVTPQQQDAKTSTEDFEECTTNGPDAGVDDFIIKDGLKHVAFEHIRPVVDCQSPLNNVDHGTSDTDAHMGGDSQCHEEQALNANRRDVPERESEAGVNLQGEPQSKTRASGRKQATDNAAFSGVDTGDKAYRCTVCGRNYPTEQALLNHDRYHRGDRPYECETCHKAFSTNSHLVTHRRTHTGERPYSCQVCNRTFADRSAFMKHERTHGPGGIIVKRYKCGECGKRFVDSCGLKKHLRIHTGERPYLCVVCQKAFSTSSTFVAHRRIHTGERPYKCDTCEKMFVTKSHLLTHRRKHTGEKPFTCGVCNRGFADGSSFRRHERLHAADKYICDVCGKGFPQESSLDRHKLSHLPPSNFTFIYENRNDLNTLNQQQTQRSPQQQAQQQEQDLHHRIIACDAQQSHCVVSQESLPVDSKHSNIGVDLSQEMASETGQVQRGSVCAIPTCDIDCDSQRNHSNAVPTREMA